MDKLDESVSAENLIELLTLRKRVDIFDRVCYYNKDNRLHRIHGPAVIYPSGKQEWWQNGRFMFSKVFD